MGERLASGNVAIAECWESFPEKVLVRKRAVHLHCIEECCAAIDRRTQKIDHLRPFFWLAV